MKNIFVLVLCLMIQRPAFAQPQKIAPAFLHGNGVGESSFGDEFHYLERTTALKIISEKLKKAGYSAQSGPILLDGFTTKENTVLSVVVAGGDPWVEIEHPFFFDFFIPELGVAVKYIGLDDCRSVGYGEETGIDYGKWDLIGAIQPLREKLSAKSPVPVVFFYDPLPKDQYHGDQPSIVELHAQIDDFLKWAKRETAAGYLPYKYSIEQFAASEDRKQEVRALARDRNQKTNIRLAAIEWLGAARDRQAVSIVKLGLEDKEDRINRATIASLGQVGGKEAETALIGVITDEKFRHNEIYAALNAINPLWTKSAEAKEMLLAWDSNAFAFYDDFNVALLIDQELALKKGRESFRTGRMDTDAQNAYLRWCTQKDLPLILDFLSNTIYIEDDTLKILKRMFPNWREDPLTRDAANKQLDNCQFLIKEREGSEIFHKIYRLNYLEPQWRNIPRIRNQVRSIIKQIQEEAKSSYIKHQFVDSIMIMNIEEAYLLLSRWWMQHDDDMSFIEAFVRSCVVFKNSKCSAIIQQNIKWNDEDTEDIRNNVMMAFRELGGVDTYPLIVKGLSDVSVEVRQGAAIAAGERKIAGAVPALIKILKNADDNALIIDAARALSQIRKQESIRPLVQAMKKWQDNPYIACQIVGALSVWNTSEVESTMMQFLKTAEPHMKEKAGGDKNKYYLSDVQPNAGVEGAIRWAIKNNRTAMQKYIQIFISCSSPRHRAIAQSAEYYLRNSN